MTAWSNYLGGKYADCAALCGNGSTDDFAYLLGACAYATGDNEFAAKFLKDIAAHAALSYECADAGVDEKTAEAVHPRRRRRTCRDNDILLSIDNGTAVVYDRTFRTERNAAFFHLEMSLVTRRIDCPRKKYSLTGT